MDCKCFSSNISLIVYKNDVQLQVVFTAIVACAVAMPQTIAVKKTPVKNYEPNEYEKLQNVAAK